MGGVSMEWEELVLESQLKAHVAEVRAQLQARLAGGECGGRPLEIQGLSIRSPVREFVHGHYRALGQARIDGTAFVTVTQQTMLDLKLRSYEARALGQMLGHWMGKALDRVVEGPMLFDGFVLHEHGSTGRAVVVEVSWVVVNADCFEAYQLHKAKSG